MFYHQLKQACLDKQTTVTSVLKQIGIGTANGTYWKNGSIPSSDIVIKLAELLQVSADYLLTGKAPEKETCSPTDLTVDEQEIITYFKKLPTKEQGKLIAKLGDIIGEDAADEEQAQTIEMTYTEFYRLPVSAGTGVYLSGDDKEILELPYNQVPAGTNFALRVSGDSMQPKFFNGDTVFIKTQPTVEVGEIGIFIVNDEGFLKKFGGDRLISLNKKYADILLKESDDISCRGKVIGKL